MHFVRTKEKVIQSTSATEVKELPILNLHKKELITTACEQFSSTEGAKPDFQSCLKNPTPKKEKRKAD